MLRRYVFWTAALVWLAVALTQSASAQPQISVPIDPDSGVFFVVNAGGGIPANGAVLLQGPYDSEPRVSGVTVGTTVPLEGTLTHIEGSVYWVWRPGQPFVAGTSVELELTSPDDFAGSSSNVLTFLIVPAIELAKPAITLEPSASLLSVIAGRACCRARVGSSATLQDSAPCFGVEYESSIQVDPGISTSAPRVITNQYLFRFTTGPNARPSFVGGSLAGVVLPVFKEQAEHYCFEVTAIELPTLVEHSYGANTGCAEHGALADLGTSPALPGPAELMSSACPAPPVGLEEVWCEVNAACESGEDSPSCGLYPHVCDGEPLAPLSASSSSPDAGASETGDGKGMGDAEVSDESPAGRRGSDGCSVAATRTSGRTAFALCGWATLLATGIATRLRRRQARARVCQGGA